MVELLINSVRNSYSQAKFFHSFLKIYINELTYQNFNETLNMLINITSFGPTIP